MQFTSIVALVSALAATSVQAAPAATTALESRQALIAYIRFYGGGGCLPAERQVLEQHLCWAVWKLRRHQQLVHAYQ
jgi:hypothetical protein